MQTRHSEIRHGAEALAAQLYSRCYEMSMSQGRRPGGVRCVIFERGEERSIRKAHMPRRRPTAQPAAAALSEPTQIHGRLYRRLCLTEATRGPMHRLTAGRLPWSCVSLIRW
eukprot:365412-Chlamydomonas_euryale.AAC.17